MIRQSITATTLLVTVALLAGCAAQQPQVGDPRLEEENRSLKQRVYDLEAEKAGLKQDLVTSQGAVGAAELDAGKWKSMYEAAKTAVPESGGTLPPEVLKKFIEIARGPWELGPTGSLKASSDILFDSGKITLKKGGQDALRNIAPQLKEILTDKRVMLRVDGHTDNTPIRFSPWKDNLHLSLMRARAVVAFLDEQGLSPNTMCAAGFGEFHPVADNATKEGQAQNRRVELSLISVTPLPIQP